MKYLYYLFYIFYLLLSSVDISMYPFIIDVKARLYQSLNIIEI